MPPSPTSSPSPSPSSSPGGSAMLNSSRSPPPPPPHSLFSAAPLPLPRSRSVQFVESASPMSRSQERRQSSVHAAGESSADEITPIVGRERGGGPKSYDATASASSATAQATGAEASASRRVDSRRRGSRGPKGTDGEGEGDGEGGSEAGGWWRKLVEKFGSVELDNKGSVARDHLALERTFLAWLRTSLAFASIGIAITQLFRLNTALGQRDEGSPTQFFHLRHLGKPLGSTFLGVAIVVLIVGGRRYFEGQYWIIRGRFPASRGSVFLVSTITAALIVTSLVVVLVISPSVKRKG